MHKVEQKDRTKTLAEFPDHILNDYAYMYLFDLLLGLWSYAARVWILVVGVRIATDDAFAAKTLRLRFFLQLFINSRPEGVPFVFEFL